MRSMRGIAVLLALCFAGAGAFAVPTYISGVPDWDQPVKAGPPPNLGTGWNAWCVPTATANIAGYYRDLGVTNAIGDAQIFPNTAAWNLPAGDYQDDTADPASSNPPAPGATRNDIGWYMNTNDMGQNPSGGMGGAYIGTMFSDVKPALDGVNPAVVGWKGYFPDNGINVTVTNAAIAAIGLDDTGVGPHTVATVWPRITAEIDAERPILGHFSYWALVGRQSVRQSGIAGLPDYDVAAWGQNPQADPGSGESYTNPDIGHTVTIVGYWLGNDPANPFYDNDLQMGPNAIIVHDNCDGHLVGAPLPLVLPFDASAPWVMNTEIVIPEPATMLLLGSAAMGLMALRRHRGTRS